MALALVAISAKATPINLDLSYTGSASFYSSGGRGNVSKVWLLDGIQAGTYALDVTVDFTTFATATNAQPYMGTYLNNVFLSWTPSITLLPRYVTKLGIPQSVSDTAMQSMNQTLTVSQTFTDHLALHTMIGPSDFGPYPPGVYLLSEVVAGTQYGWGQTTATFSAAMTITAVPDSGSTLPLALVGLALCGLVHRSMRRAAAAHKSGMCT